MKGGGAQGFAVRAAGRAKGALFLSRARR